MKAYAFVSKKKNVKFFFQKFIAQKIQKMVKNWNFQAFQNATQLKKFGAI